MKKCKNCSIEKAFTEFYKHSKMKDGYLNTCKQCKIEQQHLIRKNNLEYYQEYDRNRPNKSERVIASSKYQKTDSGKLARKKATTSYRGKYPLKYSAHCLVNNALRDGKLTKPSICEECKKLYEPKQIHGHHCDYSKPLEVMWLCETCHKEWHSKYTPINGD